MNLRLLKLVGTFMFVFTISFSNAQLISGNAFMKSNYVEMAVSPYGVYISNVAPPAGYHVIAGAYLLGMTADSDKDGWEVGVPIYCGDYFAPGSPEEGFAIQCGTSSYYNTYYGAPADAAGSIISYTSTPSVVTTIWRGTIAAKGLQVTQITTINSGKSMAVTTVQLKNTSAVNIPNVYYTRNADPDNEQQWSGDFTTNNIILKNHPVDAYAAVSATGLTYGCYFAMASQQSNATASYGGFSTSTVIAKDAWNGMTPFSITGSTVGDVAIQMNFKVGSIPAGTTKVVTFIYGTNEDDINFVIGLTGDDVVQRMEQELNGGTDVEFHPEFKISPNPTQGIMQVYGYDMSTTSDVQLQIVNLMGQTVYSGAIENANGIVNSTIQLDAALANGTYYANFLVDGKAFTKSFILSR